MAATTASKIKKLFRRGEPEQIQSALTLIATLNEPELFQELLEGVESTSHKIIPNDLFKGTSKTRARLLSALLSVLNMASHLPQYASILEMPEYLEIELEEIGFLNGCKNLKELKISGARELIEPLILPKLEILVIDSCSIDFNYIEGCTALKEISCYGIKITGGLNRIGRLAALSKLYFRDVKEIPCNDFSWVGPSSPIQNLYITQYRSGNGWSSGRRWVPMSGQDITGNRIDSVKGLENLKKLKKLYIDGYSFSDFTINGSLPELEEITIINNSALHTFTPPEPRHPIAILNLTDCTALSKINPGNYTPAPDIKLNNTSIKEIPALNGVETFPTEGLAECNKLENLDGLKSILKISVDELDLYGCRNLRSLDGLSKFKNLKIYDLETKTIPEINISNGIVSLRLLNPQSLEGIGQFAELTALKIIDGNIPDLRGLSGLPKLEILDISNNKTLTSLAGIEQLKSLKILNLIYTENLNDVSVYEDKSVNLRLEMIYLNGSRKKLWNFPAHLHGTINMESAMSAIPLEHRLL